MKKYSIYVDGERLGWAFRSLWAARYHASCAAEASGAAVLVIDDGTGAVMFSFERAAGGPVRCTYADPDALRIVYPPEKCFYNMPA
ncbi:MAG: hypothetical protein J6S14_11910 [Clostridia bacterium]|nr:hypothetical protein [Clostridia bacterium]